MVPTLDMINDGFLAAMRTNCFDLLQLHVELSSGNLQMLALRDYPASLPTPSSIHLVHVPQLGGTVVITLEPHLVACLVDAFFGGGKRTLPDRQRSEFTAAEQRIVAKFLVHLLGALRLAGVPLRSLASNCNRPSTTSCLRATKRLLRRGSDGHAGYQSRTPERFRVVPYSHSLHADRTDAYEFAFMVQSPGQRSAGAEVPRNSALRKLWETST